jgi:hypothetical protein
MVVNKTYKVSCKLCAWGPEAATTLARVVKHFGEPRLSSSEAPADLHCLQKCRRRGATGSVVLYPGRRDKKNTPRSTRSSRSQAPRQHLLELLQAIQDQEHRLARCLKPSSLTPQYGPSHI